MRPDPSLKDIQIGIKQCLVQILTALWLCVYISTYSPPSNEEQTVLYTWLQPPFIIHKERLSWRTGMGSLLSGSGDCLRITGASIRVCLTWSCDVTFGIISAQFYHKLPLKYIFVFSLSDFDVNCLCTWNDKHIKNEHYCEMGFMCSSRDFILLGRKFWFFHQQWRRFWTC